MVAGDLTKYPLSKLRKVVQTHNKEIRSGKVGNYLPGLHKTKKDGVIRFIKKNFKVAAHASGGTQVKNKHSTHLLEYKRKVRKRARGDKDDEKQGEVQTPRARRRKKKPQAPPSAAIPSTPDPSPKPTKRIKTPKGPADPKLRKMIRRKALKSTLGDLVYASFRKTARDDLTNTKLRVAMTRKLFNMFSKSHPKWGPESRYRAWYISQSVLDNSAKPAADAWHLSHPVKSDKYKKLRLFMTLGSE